VGFPGETEADFSQTYEFLEESALDYFHVFSYSPRPGTEAAGRKPVDSRIVKSRSAILRKLSREKQAAFHKRFIGRTLDSIVIEKKEGRAEVLTPNYIPVWAGSPRSPEGSEVRVRIIGITSTRASGEIVGPSQGDRP